MSAGRIYWGQIVFVLGAIALGAIAATQWTAHQLGYQSALGMPDAKVFGWPFYAPWRFFGWWFQYDSYAREIFEQGGLIFLYFAAGAVATSFVFSLWRAREAKTSDTYGSARWARPAEVRKLGLTRGDGVVLGTWQRQILRHDGDEHVLVVAPTNTGKSVGISLPTGLVWRHSFIALDLKGENWRIPLPRPSIPGDCYPTRYREARHQVVVCSADPTAVASTAELPIKMIANLCEHGLNRLAALPMSGFPPESRKGHMDMWLSG